MAEINISEQIAKAHTEALRTGDWSGYTKLSLMKSDAETTLAEAEKIKIENGKALFLPDFERMEEQLQKKLADPKLEFNERLQVRAKLTTLSLHWQENGVGNLDVLRGMRDSIIDELRALSEMYLDPATLDLHSRDRRAKVAELTALITEGEKKGMV